METNQTYKNLTIFLSIIFLLILIGIIFVYSSSFVYALEKFNIPHYYAKKQIIGLLIGLIFFLIIIFLPSKFIKLSMPYTFICSLLLTGVTTIENIGTTIHGSKRWIFIKGISLQPSEFLKVSFVLYIAYLLMKKQNKISSITSSYIQLLIVVTISSLVLLKQPDFGQTITLCLTALTLFFIADYKIKYILLTASSSIPVILYLIISKPYRLNRIFTYLNPWNDPKGSGFQIIQSLIAIGSGSLNGVGIAQSKQKFFYLPMQHTDFIFSIIAEETGFLGTIFLITLYICLLYYGILLAISCDNLFYYYSILGFTLLISYQTLINLYVTTGLLPTKGLGLPFISYGNSALIAHLCMIGFIVNFALQKSTKEDFNKSILVNTNI